MKVKDIIQEGVVSTLAKNFVGDTNWRAIQHRKQEKARQQASSIPQVDPTKLQPISQVNPTRTAPAPDEVEPTPQSKFLQQFEIVDDNPVTIQWKKQLFQRKDGTGDWVNFPGGKPAPEQMIAALDKVSPVTTPAKPVKPIAVKDNAGVVWTKDEDNKVWRSDAGVVANPANAKELEKRALPQYQARQMST